jgi:hypothetical protein
MKHSGRTVVVGLLIALATGCNHPSPSNDAHSDAAKAQATLAKPAAGADENTWGSYLSEQGKLHGKDVAMKPYIYVIPTGESMAAGDRRTSEAESIVQSVGPIVMPGGMLILGGPDAKQTTTFIDRLAKQLKADSLKGVVVMVVSDAPEEARNAAALKPSGASVRFVAM